MDAAIAHVEIPSHGGRCFPHGVHSGVQLANFSTAGCIVSEHYYPVGLRMFEHAHETPFINASLPRRVHRTGSALGQKEVLEPEVNFSPAGMEHPRLVTDNDYQLLHIDLLPAHAAELVGERNLRREFTCADPYTFRLAILLRDELRDIDVLSAFQVDALISEMAASIVRLSSRSDSTLAPRWMKRILSEIDQRYKENLCLDDLATEARVHPVHVSRVFRRCHGETLRDYIRRLRIQEACRLLKSGARSIAEVALEIGYYDESHFAKAFKRVIGTTPGQYRDAVGAH